MPTKQKKKTNVKKTVKNTNVKKGKEKQEQNQTVSMGMQIFGIALFFVAAAMIIALFFNVGDAGAWLRQLLRGLFGFGAYILPFVAVISGIYAVLPRTPRRKIRLVSGAVFFVALCMGAALFSFNNADYANLTDMMTSLYAKGNETLLSGGVIGGMISEPTASGIGTVFTALIVGFAAIVTVMIYFNISLGSVFSKIKERSKAKAEAEKAEKEKEIEEIFEEDEKQKKRPEKKDETPFVPDPIDIPIDDDTSKKKKKEKKKGNALDIEVDDPPFTPDDVITDVPERITITEEEKKELITEVGVAAATATADVKPYRFPSLNMLCKNTSETVDATAELRQMADKIVTALASFGVETKITNVTRGPSVTRFELVPGFGVKIAKIANLSNDLALALAASSVRIEAPIPGKAAIGIEVPNKKKTAVYLRDILSSKEFKESQSPVSAALGKDISGAPVVMDISRMPHLLIAGSTGSGKSVCINSIIMSILYKSSPEEVRLIMIDPKVVELSDYNGIPHLLIPVVNDPKKAAGALCWAVAEMERRYKLLDEYSVKQIFAYNALAETDPDVEKLPQIVVIIDEFADLMMTAPKEVEDAICRLAQKARAAGMYLIVATQRPSADVITGVIKTNIPSRIAFAVADRVNSNIILDGPGAEKLIGRGDMLYLPLGADKPIRAQGCFTPDGDIANVIKFIKENGTANYDDSVMKEIEHNAAMQDNPKGQSSSADDDDPLLGDAIDIALDAHSIATSMLQRRLKVGYGRAARLIDAMEDMGIVSAPDGQKPRQVLVTKAEWEEIRMRRKDTSECQDKV